MSREVEKRHKERGARRIVVSGGPRYIIPGVDIKAYPAAVSFFLKNGLKEVNRDSVPMYRSLMDYDVPKEVLTLETDLAQEAFRFQQLDEHLIDLLMFLRKVPWRETIAHEVNDPLRVILAVHL